MGQIYAPRLGVCILLSAVGACATSPDSRGGPAWLAQAAGEARDVDYPALSSLPDKTSMLRAPSGWNQLEAELAAVEARLKASPRSEVAEIDPTTQAELEAQSRALLEQKGAQAEPDRDRE